LYHCTLENAPISERTATKTSLPPGSTQPPENSMKLCPLESEESLKMKRVKRGSKMGQFGTRAMTHNSSQFGSKEENYSSHS